MNIVNIALLTSCNNQIFISQGHINNSFYKEKLINFI